MIEVKVYPVQVSVQEVFQLFQEVNSWLRDNVGKAYWNYGTTKLKLMVEVCGGHTEINIPDTVIFNNSIDATAFKLAIGL